MAGKTDIFKKREIRQKQRIDYENQNKLHGVINKSNFDFIGHVGEQTIGHLGDEWIQNMYQNMHLWNKHGDVHILEGLAKNKAVIGVGAGPSFNKNKELLKIVAQNDSNPDWGRRDFVIISSNHQFKPLLKMGIIPDYVLLVDASSKGVYEQLCEDIPYTGKHTTLITGIHCSPKIVNEWLKQDRPIKFFLSTSPELCDVFYDLTGEDPKKYSMEMGGNVLNGAWMLSIAIMKSTVFLALGNDLSYPMYNDADKRRSEYYADGDYSSNAKDTGTGRDEANTGKIWAGFKLKPKKIITNNDRYDIELDEVGTSHTLWVYKIWLESAMMQLKDSKKSFHYFNCTEGGILGVMSKSERLEEMDKIDNWYLLDDVCPKYHTAMFKDAVATFIKAKEMMEEECPILDVQHATSSDLLS